MMSSFAPAHPAPYLAVPQGKSRTRYQLSDQPIDWGEVPSLLWSPAYKRNHEELFRKFQHISDHMLAGGPSVYNHNNPNTPACRAAYRGEIDQKEYEMADAFYGKPGSAKMKDYGFFHSVTQRDIGNALDQPLKFSYRDISPASVERQMRARAAQLDQAKRRQVADALAKMAEESGSPADFSFLADPDFALPTDGIFTAPTHSLEERAGHALLVDTIKTHRTRDEIRQLREDAIQINARMAHVVADRRGVRPVRLDPDRVHWIAPGPITTDRDCDAIGTWDHLSIPEILNQDGHLFPNSGTIRGLSKTVEDMRAGAPFRYNPRQYWLAGEHQRVQPGDMDTPLLLTAMWNDMFYPGSDVLGRMQGDSITVLRHIVYFKMIRFMNARVLINGKRATDESYKEWQLRNYESDKDINFEPMDDDEKAKSGDYVKKIPIVNWWQGRRYGHNVVLEVKRCTHVPRYPTPKLDVRSPIVIHVNRKRGFIALGLDFRRMWNILWNRIEEQLNLGGAESALLIDKAQVGLKESKSMMWQAKKTALLHYNSATLQDRSNVTAQKHLTRVQLTNESNTINNMLALAGLLKSVYDAMVGDPGKAGAYDSANKLAMLSTQQSAITGEFDYLDNQFQNDMFQRTAEVQKTVVKGDQYAEVNYEGASSGRVAGRKNGRQTVYIPKTLSEVQPVIEVDNGLDLMRIRQKIEGMAERVLPSGGASGIREFIRLMFEDDPYEALAIFDAGMNEVEKAEAAAAQSANQNAQQRNQVEATKAQVPIEVARIRSEADLMIAHAKEQRKAQDADMKGDLTDIDARNRREEMMLQNELDTGQQDLLQSQQTEQQAALNQQQAELSQAEQGNPYPGSFAPAED